MKICLAGLMTVALLPTFATAEADPNAGFDLTYGAGLVGLSGVYVGQEDELLPFPVIAVAYGKWSLSVAKGIQFRALETATTNLSVGIIYDPAGLASPSFADTVGEVGVDWLGNEATISASRSKLGTIRSKSAER